MTEDLRAACARSVHVLASDGSVYRGGLASLFILRHTGWGWFAALLMLPPMVWVAQLFYLLVSRNRPFFSKFLFKRE